ncbi:MAG TPA: helix-turn-helix domain-containing protein [Burkholderiales bacterium]|nr:helix-turn-helix domain-containing protein [Burkholderiales bacterium]
MSIPDRDSDIGARIKAAREALGMTQKELAKRAGIPLSSLRQYEIRDRVPGGDALEKLAAVGISPQWLLLGQGPMLRLGVAEQAEEYLAGRARLEPHARRIEAILRLIESIDDDERRGALLDEIFARAQDAQRLDELARALEALQRAAK